MWELITKLHQNQIAIIQTIITVIFTLLTAVLGIYVAFKQIKKQFEHKVIYEGWKEFQRKMFRFSSEFSNYSSKIQWLNYFIESQDNSLVNKGNKIQYRTEKWQEITNAHQKFQKANVAFLRSFETHEVVFLELKKMKSLFQCEVRKKVNDPAIDFFEKIFPEMYGLKNNYSTTEMKDIINGYWADIVDTGVLLDDFRVELQSISIGKVLEKKVPKRQPDKGLSILTKKGFELQKRQPKRLDSEL